MAAGLVRALAGLLDPVKVAVELGQPRLVLGQWQEAMPRAALERVLRYSDPPNRWPCSSSARQQAASAAAPFRPQLGTPAAVRPPGRGGDASGEWRKRCRVSVVRYGEGVPEQSGGDQDCAKMEGFALTNKNWLVHQRRALLDGMAASEQPRVVNTSRRDSTLALIHLKKQVVMASWQVAREEEGAPWVSPSSSSPPSCSSSTLPPSAPKTTTMWVCGVWRTTPGALRIQCEVSSCAGLGSSLKALTAGWAN